MASKQKEMIDICDDDVNGREEQDELLVLDVDYDVPNRGGSGKEKQTANVSPSQLISIRYFLRSVLLGVKR